MKRALIIYFVFLSVLAAQVVAAVGVESEKAIRVGYHPMADSITVSGRVRNVSDGMSRTIIINDCEIASRGGKELSEISEGGYFSRKIPLLYPHTITVNYNIRNFINVFAAPGDSVFLDIDASTSPLTVTFSGDKADINQQYDPAFQHHSRYYWDVSLPVDTTPLDEYMTVFKDYVKRGADRINVYAKQHGLSEEVVSMLMSDNLFVLANMASGFKGRNEDEKRGFFLDPVFDIYNVEHSKVMIYPFHISAIIHEFPDVRDSAPKSLARDIMYACDEGAAVPDSSVFSNQIYYDYLYRRAEKVKEISVDDITPRDITVFVDGEIKALHNENPVTWLINEYKGRPIYLDVSATWCGPCLAALKGSESLREHFKDSDIRFAVIWLRSNREDWLKVAPTIPNAIHIFVDNADMTNRLTKSLHVDGFPTYLFIDREGKIVQSGVPSYLSPELPDFLNRCR